MSSRELQCVGVFVSLPWLLPASLRRVGVVLEVCVVWVVLRDDTCKFVSGVFVKILGLRGGVGWSLLQSWDQTGLD